jgi:hypothetical protein
MALNFLDAHISELDKVERRTRRDQDQAFCDAMLKAVWAGLEHPPMLGIDTRPGTTRPVTMVR